MNNLKHIIRRLDDLSDRVETLEAEQGYEVANGEYRVLEDQPDYVWHGPSGDWKVYASHLSPNETHINQLQDELVASYQAHAKTKEELKKADDSASVYFKLYQKEKDLKPSPPIYFSDTTVSFAQELTDERYRHGQTKDALRATQKARDDYENKLAAAKHDNRKLADMLDAETRAHWATKQKIKEIGWAVNNFTFSCPPVWGWTNKDNAWAIVHEMFDKIKAILKQA